MVLVRWLKDVSQAQSPEIGAKAALLGSAITYGWSVPIGFLVTGEFYDRFLTVTNLRDKIDNLAAILNYDDDERLQTVANEIQKLIIETEMPSGLASELGDYYNALSVRQEETSQTLLSSAEDVKAVVRSSVEMPAPYNDMPGTFGLFLNLYGKKKICKAVQACWASRYTLKVLKLLHAAHTDPKELPLSVIVQKMIMPDRMGDVYTADERAEENEVVIDAYWSIRELSEPELENADSYVFELGQRKLSKADVRKKRQEFVKDIDTGHIVRQDLTPRKSEAQILDDKDVFEVGTMAGRMRKQFGHEVQITWAYMKDRLHVLQVIMLGEVEKMEDEVIEPAQEGSPETVDDIEKQIESEDFGPKEDESLVSEYKEQQVDWKPQKTAEQMMDSANELAGHAMGNALRAVTLHLKTRYAKLYSKMPPAHLSDLITGLSAEKDVPHSDELLSLYETYTSFMQNYDSLQPNTIERCLSICAAVIKEF